jgi:hypothetical protein
MRLLCGLKGRARQAAASGQIRLRLQTLASGRWPNEYLAHDKFAISASGVDA